MRQRLLEQRLGRRRETLTERDRALGSRRCFHAAAAAADVLLLLDLHQAVTDLDEVDHLGRFELPGHWLEPITARWTSAIGLVELDQFLVDWQC